MFFLCFCFYISYLARLSSASPRSAKVEATPSSPALRWHCYRIRPTTPAQASRVTQPTDRAVAQRVVPQKPRDKTNHTAFDRPQASSREARFLSSAARFPTKRSFHNAPWSVRLLTRTHAFPPKHLVRDRASGRRPTVKRPWTGARVSLRYE